MFILQCLICFVVAYLIGCFNLAYLIGRKKGLDIRKSGSGNPGASNAMVTMGWKYGVLVGLSDILKAVLPILAVRLIFADKPILWFITASGCILGHMFPVFLRFKGGKGLASLVGALAVIDYRAFLIAGAIIIAITLIFDYIAISTIAVSFSYPVLAFFTDNTKHVWFTVAIASLVTIAMFVKHIENIKRIASGTEIGLRNASSGKYRKK